MRVSLRTGEAAVIGQFDVVVCGGGPAGCAAAIAAARQGMKTLLLEGQGQLGGMGTSGLVSHWLGGRTKDCKRWSVGGIFRELSERGVVQGVAILPAPEVNSVSPHGWQQGGQLVAGVPFDPYGMAALLDEVMAEAGVEVGFFSRVVDVIVDKEKISHVIFHNKSGFQAAAAATVIDATGDADVAALSGCATVLGREEDRLMTPVTLQMHLDHVDVERIKTYVNARTKGGYRWLDEIQTLMDQGEWPFSYNRLISVQLTDADTFMVNTSRLTGCDGTNGASVSRAMAQGRRESLQLLAILRRHIPGFGHARIKAIAPLLGVRETRRIVGDFALTVEDLVSGRGFEDTIGFSSYGWDLPDPKKPSYQPFHEKKVQTPELTPIPYRVMLPRGIGNLICPGRAVSCQRDVLGPLRVMAPCMAMGEAAGIAAARCAIESRPLAQVDITMLKNTLRQAGAVVDMPAPL